MFYVFKLEYSVVGVLNNPALKLEFSILSDHALSEPDLSDFVVEEDDSVE